MKSPSQSVIQSFRCAFNGLVDVVRSGRNAKIHAVIAVAVVVFGFVENLSAVRWSILVLTIGVVFAAEAANTATEHVVDLVSLEHHELARRAKDAAAASVLCVAIAAVVVGVLIFRLL